MVKPARVHYSGTGVFVDDIDMDRVQAVGSSSRYNDEDLKELGSLKITEVVDDVEDMELTLDTNEYGSNKTLASFANKGFGLRVFAVPDGSNPGSAQIKVEEGSFIVNGVRIPFAGTTVPITPPTAEDAAVVSINTDPNNLTVSITFNDVGSENPTTPPPCPAGEVELAHLLHVGTDGVVTQDNIVDKRSWATIDILDFELAKADVYIPVIPSGASEIQRTSYMENVFVNRIDLNYTVDGVATENYGAETDNKVWYFNDSKHIVVDQFEATGGETSYVLSRTPTQLKNGKYMLRAILNGNEMEEGTDFTVDAGTNTVTFSGVTLSAGDQVKFRYTSGSGGVFHDDSDEMVSLAYEHPGGVKGGHIKVYLTENGVDNELLRVQSVRISASLTREALRQLSTVRPYERPLNIPVEITCSLEFTDSDLEVLARLAGETYDANEGVTGTNSIDIGKILKDRGLLVEIYRLHDEQRAELPENHPFQYPLKKVRIPYLIPTDENMEARVDANNTQTFDFRSHRLQITA